MVRNHHLRCSLTRMSRTRALLCVALASLLLVGLCVVVFWSGGDHALKRLSIERVTPTQVAQAMKNDRFYSDYKLAVLIMRGTVVSVDANKAESTVRFNTNSTFEVTCTFARVQSTVLVGSAITVVSVGADAARQSHGIHLGQCTIGATFNR